MQQGICNGISNSISRNVTIREAITPAPMGCRAGLGRRIARKWDLYGVAALMLSSGMYGVYAVTHCL